MKEERFKNKIDAYERAYQKFSGTVVTQEQFSYLMNWNDSDIGYTFWDEMWNDPEDEKRDKRGKEPRTEDKKKDDHS